MKFTDADLKRLKEADSNLLIPVFKLDALLARLEAAEHKAELGWLNRAYIPTGAVGDLLAIEKADEVWRKAAGKGDNELPAKFANTDRVD